MVQPMAIYKKPTLLIMAGHAGTGKTTFSRLFFAQQAQAGRTWAFLDKDTVSGTFVNALMQMHTGDGFDRDSSTYSEKVRPLEYTALDRVVRDNLMLGTSCISCAPYGIECKSREAFEAYAESFSDVAHTIVLWSHVSPQEAHVRITARAHPMDKYKLDNWDAYVSRRHNPQWLHAHPNAFWFESGTSEKTTAMRWLFANA